MNYDILHIDGKPHILVPLHDYTALVSGKKNAELPQEVLNQIALGQETPIKILRKHRKMTQHDLAKESGLSRPYLTEIETGRKDGSIRALKSIAKALQVSIESITKAA